MALETSFRGGVFPVIGTDAFGRPALTLLPGPGGGPRVRGFDEFGSELFSYLAPEQDLPNAANVQVVASENRLAITVPTADGPRLVVFDLPTGERLRISSPLDRIDLQELLRTLMDS